MWVNIPFADVDRISIFLTQNIGDIDIDIDIDIHTAVLYGLITHFIIATKVVNDVNVIS